MQINVDRVPLFLQAHFPPHGNNPGDPLPPDMPGESSQAKLQFAHPQQEQDNYVVYITSNAIGKIEDTHGKNLMGDFLFALTDVAPQPRAIILVHSAIRLALPGSAPLESLSLMHEQGVEIMIAQKSMKEIPGGENVAVGKASTMHAILRVLLHADKIITP
jgi:hypothetical protein